MGVLKKCVRNRVRPEGSIASAYRTEEVIDFCVDFIDNLKPIGVPESRYEGRQTRKGTLGKKSYVCTDDFSFKKAHYTVLQQSSLVDPYIEEHKKILLSKFPKKSEAWITREHMNTFCSWLRKHLMHNIDISEGTILEYLNIPRVRDKWKHILYDSPRSKEYQPKQRCSYGCHEQ